MENSFKKAAPSIVKSFANWFEIDFSIKIFGVQVFKFHYPPTAEKDNLVNSENVFEK